MSGAVRILVRMPHNGGVRTMGCFMAKRVVLHYGGQEYKLAEGEGGALASVDLTMPGSVTVPLANGAHITILLGPGISAAIIETEYDETARPVPFIP